MITLEKCAAVLNRNGNNYSNEEIKQIREFLYNLACLDEQVRRDNNGSKDSGNLYESQYGRAS